jgi:hypothetical protein
MILQNPKRHLIFGNTQDEIKTRSAVQNNIDMKIPDEVKAYCKETIFREEVIFILYAKLGSLEKVKNVCEWSMIGAVSIEQALWDYYRESYTQSEMEFNNLHAKCADLKQSLIEAWDMSIFGKIILKLFGMKFNKK